MKARKITVETICFLFILLFAYAAISKLMIYEGFVWQIRTSSLIGDYANFLAWFVPGSELVIASLIAIPRFRRTGLYAATVLMLLFTIYIGAIIGMGKDQPCSCGGVLSILGWTEHFIFNIAFITLGVVGIYFTRSSGSGHSEESSIVAKTV